MAKILLHLEGFIVFLLCIYLYSSFSFNWLLFIVLLFVPDLSMIGYVKNTKIGVIFYNLIHTYSLSVLLILISLWMSNLPLLSIGLIWTAHIGMDRAVGFGLKYPADFKDTHLQRLK